MNEAEIGLRIQRVRESKNLSQETVSERAKIATRTLQRIEDGAGNPTIKSILAIAEALGCSLADLVAEKPTPLKLLISILSAFEKAELDTQTAVLQSLDLQDIAESLSETNQPR